MWSPRYHLRLTTDVLDRLPVEVRVYSSIGLDARVVVAAAVLVVLLLLVLVVLVVVVLVVVVNFLSCNPGVYPVLG